MPSVAGSSGRLLGRRRISAGNDVDVGSDSDGGANRHRRNCVAGRTHANGAGFECPGAESISDGIDDDAASDNYPFPRPFTDRDGLYGYASADDHAESYVERHGPDADAKPDTTRGDPDTVSHGNTGADDHAVPGTDDHAVSATDDNTVPSADENADSDADEHPDVSANKDANPIADEHADRIFGL